MGSREGLCMLLSNPIPRHGWLAVFGSAKKKKKEEDKAEHVNITQQYQSSIYFYHSFLICF